MDQESIEPDNTSEQYIEPTGLTGTNNYYESKLKLSYNNNEQEPKVKALDLSKLHQNDEFQT